MKMSRNLLKISQNILDLADESIQLKKLEEFSPKGKKKYYFNQVQSTLESIKELVLEYSHELEDISQVKGTRQTRIEIAKAEVKRFAREKRKNKKEQKFRAYKTNMYSKISNFFMEDFSFAIARKKPEFFRKLSHELTLANIKVLSRSYLSIILFSTIISFPIITAIAFILLLNNRFQEEWQTMGVGTHQEIMEGIVGSMGTQKRNTSRIQLCSG